MRTRENAPVDAVYSRSHTVARDSVGDSLLPMRSSESRLRKEGCEACTPAHLQITHTSNPNRVRRVTTRDAGGGAFNQPLQREVNAAALGSLLPNGETGADPPPVKEQNANSEIRVAKAGERRAKAGETGSAGGVRRGAAGATPNTRHKIRFLKFFPNSVNNRSGSPSQ